MRHMDGALMDLHYRYKNSGKAITIGKAACFSSGDIGA
jgi:hypothetical protein